MSSKAVELVQRAERGERVAKVREALGMTGEAFGAKLTTLAKSLGVRTRYDRAKVSRLESGGRKLGVEEAAMIAMIDPDKRTVGWLVFGDRALQDALTAPKHKPGELVQKHDAKPHKRAVG